jgi:hypothetical protein
MYRSSSTQTICFNGVCKEVSVDAFTDQNGKIVRQKKKREFKQQQEDYAIVSPFLQHEDTIFQNSKGRTIPHVITYNIHQGEKCPCKSLFGCSRCSI